MKRILYIIGVLGLTFSSCTKSEIPQESGAVVNFTAAKPMSRTSSDGLRWEEGDLIGVIQSEGSIVKYHIYSPTTGSMVLEKDYDAICSSAGADYTAYYCAENNLATNVYPADITSQNDVADTPLLWAKTENQSGADITFNFVHQYVRLEFTLLAGSEVTDITAITAAKLIGANAKGNFDLNTGVWSDVTTSDITLNVDNGKIMAYALGQDNVKNNVKNNVQLVITANGKEYTTEYATEKWESGKKYLYNVTVGNK